MIGVYDVLNFLFRLPAVHEQFRHGYCGKLDAKQPKSLGVYPLKRRGKPYRAYGGLESFEIVGVSLLIHYNKNVDESQYAACKLFEQLREPFLNEDFRLISDRYLDEEYPSDETPACQVHYPDIDKNHARVIKYIDLIVPEPVPVGTDDNGIYEFVIELQLYVEKEM